MEELIRGAENMTLAMPGGDLVDFNAMRRDLGLIENSADAELATYDPSVDPDPAEWLELDEQERTTLIEEYHLNSTLEHPPVPGHGVHNLLHLVPENQIALGSPPQVRETMARLVAAGLSRHEAVHAIGEAIASHIRAMLDNGESFDQAAYARTLAGLEPSRWRGTAP